MVERRIDEQDEEKIVNFGALNYTPAKMASILDWPEDEVDELMKDQKSRFSRLYHKGADLSDYLIDKKLFEMAKAGDLKALQQYEFRKKQQK